MKATTSSISTKLIVASLFMVLFSSVPLALIISNNFAEESLKKEENINHTFALAKAAEAENVIQSLIDKSKTIGSLFLLQQDSNQVNLLESVDLLLNNDRDIFAVDVLNLENEGFRLARSFYRRAKVLEIQIDDSVMDRIRRANPFPLSTISQDQIPISPVVKDLPEVKGVQIPLIAIGLPLARNSQGVAAKVMITYFQLSRLQRIFSVKNYRQSFLVNRLGQVLAHPDEQLVLSGESLANHPVVKLADETTDPSRQIEFYDDSKKVSSRGVFVRTALGPIVVTQLANDIVVRPAKQAKRFAVIFAGVILSISCALIFWLSAKITQPIEKLASLIRQVSKGNFNISAGKVIDSNDEVGELAVAFDDMIVGLKERDKVKNLFNKFVGSTISDDLINSEIKVGGVSKEVTVFFSDIRGFTAYSEQHSAEDVVKMLNEYFKVMVGIINERGGVVDKFIGDAIMAVWGIPKATEYDTENAIAACLQMRIALKELNEAKLARGETPLMIGMSLHRGFAVSGTVGSEDRMEYTVIGDTVNLTSRIEAATKSFGTDFLVTEAVFKASGDNFWIEEAGKVKVKGKAENILVYKVRGVHRKGKNVEIKTPYSEFDAEDTKNIKLVS